MNYEELPVNIGALLGMLANSNDCYSPSEKCQAAAALVIEIRNLQSEITQLRERIKEL